MDWIWQHKDWPNFTFDSAKVDRVVYDYALEAGTLSGAVSQLTESEQLDTYVDRMIDEALATSKIEGEEYRRSDVRSSIKNYLGLNNHHEVVLDPRAEGVAALMLDVRDQFKEDLTIERLNGWHKTLIPEGEEERVFQRINRGQLRSHDEPMQIVSGAYGREKVHYEAPPSDQVHHEMEQFLDWYNGPSKELPGPVRAALAHLQFELIHPYEDGNGRLGRSIAEHAISQDLGRPTLISLSQTIEENRKEYYQQLQTVCSGQTLDVSGYLQWFAETVKEAQISAKEKVGFVLEKAEFWNKHQNPETPLNDRQVKVIGKLFDSGTDGFPHGLSNKQYKSMTKCSVATASRDLNNLVERGMFMQLAGGGRATRYILNTPILKDIFKDRLQENAKPKVELNEHQLKKNSDMMAAFLSKEPVQGLDSKGFILAVSGASTADDLLNMTDQERSTLLKDSAYPGDGTKVFVNGLCLINQDDDNFCLRFNGEDGKVYDSNCNLEGFNHQLQNFGAPEDIYGNSEDDAFWPSTEEQVEDNTTDLDEPHGPNM